VGPNSVVVDEDGNSNSPTSEVVDDGILDGDLNSIDVLGAPAVFLDGDDFDSVVGVLHE
jgi:hypothetical protein